jgi:hypothetical protein
MQVPISGEYWVDNLSFGTILQQIVCNQSEPQTWTVPDPKYIFLLCMTNSIYYVIL